MFVPPEANGGRCGPQQVSNGMWAETSAHLLHSSHSTKPEKSCPPLFSSSQAMCGGTYSRHSLVRPSTISTYVSSYFRPHLFDRPPYADIERFKPILRAPTPLSSVRGRHVASRQSCNTASGQHQIPPVVRGHCTTFADLSEHPGALDVHITKKVRTAFGPSAA